MRALFDLSNCVCSLDRLPKTLTTPFLWDCKCNRAVKAATMILNLTAGDNGGSLTV